MKYSIEEVREYWNSHLNCTQFLIDKRVTIGSDEFYCLLEESMRRYRYKEKLFSQLANECEGQRLLEIGCGLGIELAKLGQLGFDVTGIDLSTRAVQLSDNYLKRRKVKGRTLVQNAEKMAFSDDTFDVVYSSGVLQHTPNIYNAISEIWRVLKPSGKVLIVLYHRNSWFYLLHKLSRTKIEFEDEDAPIINAYTRTELKSLFSRFRNVKISCEYFHPEHTKRQGLLPILFNSIFIPIMKVIPSVISRQFGWHLVLVGIK